MTKMKITIDRLKEIILEEIDKTDQTNENVLGLPPGTPRMPMSSPGTASPVPEEPEEEMAIDSFEDIFKKIMNSPDGSLSLNKEDATILAGLIAKENLK
tara:strand:- start:53 stop:349 length:297 start_codon:yes stop_codon:yes gene_type:complete